jgi:hypothetical protein
MQEKRGAERFGGYVNPGSGNGWLHKSDVRTPDFLIEYKRTDKQSFILKQKELNTAETQALLENRLMLFGIQLGNRNYILLTEEDFDTLRAA